MTAPRRSCHVNQIKSAHVVAVRRSADASSLKARDFPNKIWKSRTPSEGKVLRTKTREYLPGAVADAMTVQDSNNV